jgi:hypothetical protein
MKSSAFRPSDRTTFTRFLAGAVLLAAGCASARSPREKPGSTSASFGTGEDAPIVRAATVVAFWLTGSDTLPEADRRTAQEEFRRSNLTVAKYLGDTDIVLVGTVNDTVVVELAGGKRRVIMLSGLDFPYGYVLIEPGYAEEFHTGIDADQDLQDAIDDYFGLDADSSGPRHRIASRPLGLPGTRIVLR